MKRTVNIALGGRCFTIEDDACNSLSSYLESYKAGLSPAGESEVMDELEMRIADLFEEKLKGREVVPIEMVREIIDQLGMPEWQADAASENYKTPEQQKYSTSKRFYRDMDTNMIGGSLLRPVHIFKCRYYIDTRNIHSSSVLRERRILDICSPMALSAGSTDSCTEV